MQPKTPAGRLEVMAANQRYLYTIPGVIFTLHSAAIGTTDVIGTEAQLAAWLRMRIDTWEPSVNAFDCAVYLAATAAVGEWDAFTGQSATYDQSQDT
jgi:hypothetical protein